MKKLLLSLTLVMTAVVMMAQSNLYVSPTGWAKWDGNSNNYEIRLNGTLVSTVNTKYYQHETDGLEQDVQYTTSVTGVSKDGSKATVTYTWTYTPCDYFRAPESFNAVVEDNNVFLNWDNSIINPPLEGDEFNYTFQDMGGNTGNLTFIDADGDGNNWMLGTPDQGFFGRPTENGWNQAALYSESVDRWDGTVYTPDNYVVCPKSYIGPNSQFSLWAAPINDAYPGDHIGVAISTESGDDPDDFDLIWEQDMPGEGSQGVSFSYTQFFIDLSQYEGQEIYIAVRHFNCTNKFIVMIDELKLSNVENKNRDIVVLFDQAAVVTNPGGGYGGADLASPQCGNETIGVACLWPEGSSYSAWDADDFVLETNSTINEIEVYGFQKNSGTTPTINGLYLSIYDGNPKNGAHVIWGDMATNLISNVEFINCYAADVNYGGATNSTRPVMRVTASGLNIPLEAGTYWLCYSMTGTAAQGPHTLPRFLLDSGVTGNAVQKNNQGSWVNVADYGTSNPLGLSMTIRGTEGGPAPSDYEFVGSMLRRNGEIIGGGILPEEDRFVDENLEEGTYNYEVTAIYREIDNPSNTFNRSCPLTATVNVVEDCSEPYALGGEAEYGQESGINLNWRFGAEWLYYDDDNMQGSTGTTGVFSWGIQFPATTLTAYTGTSITKVSMMNRFGGDYTLKIYSGSTSAPVMLLSQTTFTTTDNLDWVEIMLNTPVYIDGTQNIWVIISNYGLSYPACFSGDTGEPNGRWLYDGENWADGAVYGLVGTWMIRAYVTTFTGAKEASNFNIYKGINNENYQLLAQIEGTGSGVYSYFDPIETNGTYSYKVTAIHQNTEVCESEPATSVNNADHVDVVFNKPDSTGEIECSNASIYPNPTNGLVMINANSMTNISVFNTIGQLVYNQDVNSDSVNLDLSGLESGMYSIRIVTEKGIITERVALTK